MKPKHILTALALACACGTYFMFDHMHVPRAPAAVALPLGDQNRTESLIYAGYREVGEPYIVRHDLTLETIPQSAWCHGSSWSESKLDLDCVWPTPDGTTRFATATVSMQLPSTDVSAWYFDRISLSAVPEMKYWLTVNAWYLLGMIIFGLLTCVFGILVLPEKQSPKSELA